MSPIISLEETSQKATLFFGGIHNFFLGVKNFNVLILQVLTRTNWIFSHYMYQCAYTASSNTNLLDILPLQTD